MRMVSRWVATLACVLCLYGGRAGASPPPKGDAEGLPKAASLLQKAKKELDRAKSLEVGLSVVGGLSTTEDHQISTLTVKKRYGGQIFTAGSDRILHESALKAWKTPKAGRGVIKESGGFIRLLSSVSGVEMDRLFAFPEKVMGDALKFSASAQWLPAEESEDSDDSEASEDVDDDENGGSEDDDPKSRGKTVVKHSGDEKPKVHGSRTLRVEATPKQALEIFNLQVNNSGCMREG